MSAKLKTKPLELPEQQFMLYDRMPGFDVDVPIVDLFRHIFGDPGALIVWQQQQALGAIITRLNRRLKQSREKVVPGKIKQTYRLTAV